MADAPKILGTDSLRLAYPKLNSAIDNSNEALTKSTTAVNTASTAESKANSVQAQFNQVVIEGDSSVEAAQARVKADGTAFTTLRDRMNDTDTSLVGMTNSQVTGVSGKRFKLIGGAIRNDGTGWKLIDDPTHKNINLLDVYIDPTDENRLRLDHSIGASTIGTLLLAPDETFSKMGLVGGNSGGSGYNLLEFAAPLSIQTAGSTTIASGHKYHMPTTTITQLPNGSGFTLTHGATSTTFPPVVSLADGGSNIGLGGEVRSEFGLTSVTVSYYQYLHGYVKYNGTTSLFELSTDNVDKATIAWDAVNTALEITHPDINEEFLISVTGAGDLQPYIYTQSAGKMLIRFKDSTGAVVTTPNTNMKFNFIRFSKVKSSFPSGLRCNIWRGLALVKPSSISEAFGNFWIIGLNGE